MYTWEFEEVKKFNLQIVYECNEYFMTITFYNQWDITMSIKYLFTSISQISFGILESIIFLVNTLNIYLALKKSVGSILIACGTSAVRCQSPTALPTMFLALCSSQTCF